MTTTNLNYKEVFQLAQEKGYKLWFLNYFLMSYEDWDYGDYKHWGELELFLIQKWLRDEKGIDIEISNQFEHPNNGKWYSSKILFANGRAVRKYIGTGLDTPYEQALLEGITEALKLI